MKFMMQRCYEYPFKFCNIVCKPVITKYLARVKI